MKKKVISFVLLIFSTFFSLFLCEISLRYLKIAPKFNWINSNAMDTSFIISKNKLLGYEFKANEKREDFNLFETFPRTNKWGFRDIDHEVEKSKFRILILGDSVVAGTGIERIKDLIGPQLNSFLDCEEVEVLSMGVSGYNLIGEAELLRAKGLMFKPDLVIQVITENDFNPDNSMIHQVSFNQYSMSTIELLKEYHLMRYLFLSFELFQKKFFPEFTSSLSHQSQMSKRSVDSALDKVVKMSKDQNFNYLTILWPSFHPKRIYTFSADNSKQKSLLSLLTNKSIPFYFINKNFPVKENNMNHYTVGDYMHVNELGAKLAAQALKDILENNKDLLPQSCFQ